MSDEEEQPQNEEDNKEIENEENVENEENKDEVNPEEGNDNEVKEEQVEQEPEQEPEQEQEPKEKENLEEKGNNEEVKEEENNIENNVQNITPIENIENEIGKENEIIDNNININDIDNKKLEDAINISNNNENGNVINQGNLQPINNEIINREMSKRNSKYNSNENINININSDNGLSFFKLGERKNSITNNLGYNYIQNQNKTTHQLLSEINNDMDSLATDLKPLFKKNQIKQDFLFNDNSVDSFDQENREIKNLIKRANKLVNNYTYNYYGHENDNGNDKYYNKNNLSEVYPQREYENGGNIYNDMERNDESSSYDNDMGYIRNVSPDKNINEKRIKNIRNYEYYNTKNYNNKPMIYRQNETFHINNSHTNNIIDYPQTYKKTNYQNNLIFSSDKIPFRKIKYVGGNMNQSLDILLNNQK